jgi:hypothetical protein
MSGPLAKAALVAYLPTSPLTRVITTFQYNPESLVHAWHQSQPPDRRGVESGNPMAVPGLPGESFDFTIYLNADDDIVSAVPSLRETAQQSGLGSRLAALEMLLYPVDGTGAASSPRGNLVGTVSAGSSSASSGWKLPNSTVPVVLFYWNTNRIVPVRVTTLSVTETLYDEDLNPRHAQAQLGLRVLTPEELAAANPAAGTAANLAVVAYNQTLATRRRLAAANAASPSGSITAHLPQ